MVESMTAVADMQPKCHPLPPPYTHWRPCSTQHGLRGNSESILTQVLIRTLGCGGSRGWSDRVEVAQHFNWHTEESGLSTLLE